MWVHPEEHKAIGKILAGFRRGANLTQQDVASRLGKPQSFVSSYEAGQRRIDVLELLRVAAAIEADPNEVFSAIVHRRGADPSRE